MALLALGIALASTAGGSIVPHSGRVEIPVLFHPLQELKVVLHFAFYEGFDGDHLFNVVSRKRG